ncbi:hypothetical protein KKA03_02020 [archaeon]|nr:hypothetical protein [archaeon]
MNEWLIFSLGLFAIWLIIYLARPKARKEMFWVSLFTMPFGLTEPLFVPEYWSPPSLFNLATRTGFDIESLIFCFAVGGIGSVLYGSAVRAEHVKMSEMEMDHKQHRHHRLALTSPIIVFIPLTILTDLNPIYSASLAMFTGGVAAIRCRPDLKKNIWVGGFMFLLLYFAFFFAFDQVYPGMVQEVWNLEAISGILIFGVPLEELMFAYTFGMMWSSVYEHALWYKVKER